MRGKNNSSSHLQRKSVELALPQIRSSIQKLVRFPKEKTIGIAEYGCSQGSNSLLAMEAVVSEYSKFSFDNTLSIVLNDLPKNDWNSLFKKFAPLVQAHESPYRGPHVLVYGNCNSFYNLIVPLNSLHFGFSATSFHWLSSVPSKLQNHIYIHHKGFTKEGNLFKSWKQRASEDWNTLIKLRCDELVSGGKLIMVVPAVDDDGLINCCEPRELLNEVLQDLFYKKNLLSQDDYLNINIPTYPRTKQEFLDGFNNVDLILDDITLERFVDPYYEMLKQGTFPLEDYATYYTRSVRSWSEGILQSAIHGAKEDFIELIYKMIKDYVMTYPHKYVFKVCQAIITCTRNYLCNCNKNMRQN